MTLEQTDFVPSCQRALIRARSPRDSSPEQKAEWNVLTEWSVHTDWWGQVLWSHSHHQQQPFGWSWVFIHDQGDPVWTMRILLHSVLIGGNNHKNIFIFWWQSQTEQRHCDCLFINEDLAALTCFSKESGRSSWRLLSSYCSCIREEEAFVKRTLSEVF